MLHLSLNGLDTVLVDGTDDTLIGGKSLTECVEGSLIGAMIDAPAEIDEDFTRCVGWQRDVGF